MRLLSLVSFSYAVLLQKCSPVNSFINHNKINVAFTVPATFNKNQKPLLHQTTRRKSQSSLFSTASEESVASATTTSQFWDFNGHKCYSEVTRPKASTEKKDLANKSFIASLLSSFDSNTSTIKDISKPEILLIHGFGCSTFYWRETKKYLSDAGYTVHAIDLLGQGKSAKPGRLDGVEYSISLWAQLVDSYAEKFMNVNDKNNGIILMGNSLGSCVALAAATGDFKLSSSFSDKEETEDERKSPFIASRIRGVGMFNCGVGMNSRNILKDPNLNSFQKTLFTSIFDLLDFLIFNNINLLTYLLESVVTEELLENALLGLYKCAKDPKSRVDDELVKSFYLPASDKGAVSALNQIYTNDAGKTPMEFHQDNPKLGTAEIPIHLVWGDEDTVTPLTGSVGQFYKALAEDNNENSSNCVSLDIINSGHVPFDEVPECNESMRNWVNDIAAKK